MERVESRVVAINALKSDCNSCKNLGQELLDALDEICRLSNRNERYRIVSENSPIKAGEYRFKFVCTNCAEETYVAVKRGMPRTKLNFLCPMCGIIH